jgi:hypothetical protein
LKVTVKNFQSWKDVSFNARGFTVISGKSNLGKSALFRALEGACFGIPGDYYVRRGSKSSLVVLEDDDLRLGWTKVPVKKSGLETSVELDGVTHTKIGREHSALTAPKGFIEVEARGSYFRPQFAAQHDGIFLVGETGTIVAEIFRLIGRGDVVSEAQRLAGVDRRGNIAEAKVRDADQASLTTGLDTRMKRLVDLEAVFERAVDSIEDNQHRIDEGEMCGSRIDELALLLDEKPIEIDVAESLLVNLADNEAAQAGVETLLLGEATIARLDEMLAQMEEKIILLIGLKGIEDVDADVASGKAEITAIHPKIVEVLDDIKALGLCPTCGKSL